MDRSIKFAERRNYKIGICTDAVACVFKCKFKKAAFNKKHFIGVRKPLIIIPSTALKRIKRRLTVSASAAVTR